MFWTIVIALIFVFWILPLLFSVIIAIAGWLVEEFGCGGAIAVGIIILLLILIF